jgi:hypothetical protein
MSGSVRPTPFRCYPYYHMMRALVLGPGASLLSKMSFASSIAKQVGL